MPANEPDVWPVTIGLLHETSDISQQLPLLDSQLIALHPLVMSHLFAHSE